MRNQSSTTITIGLWLLIHSGCGRAIVDPGRSTAIISPPTAQPVIPTESTGLPTLSSPEIEQVPTDSVLRLPKETTAATYHAVQSGETLGSVAKKYGVTVEQLRTSNGLDPASSLKTQQLLFIPRSH
jgi:LysM repeat protein